MKKSLFVALALLSVSGSVVAAPFASQLHIENTVLPANSGSKISYVLNESADTVTIEILNSTDEPVATFTGTTASGKNEVVWNGTVNNGSGAALPSGLYTFRIKADKNVAGTSWYQTAAVKSTWTGASPSGNTTAPNVFMGFSPNDLFQVKNQSLDEFGLTFAWSHYGGDTVGGFRNSGAVKFNSDLTLVDPAGDGLTNRSLISPYEASADAMSAFDIWSGSIDGNRIYLVGQSGTADQLVRTGLVTDAAISSANTGNYTVGAPRNCVVVTEGTKKYMYLIRTNSTIEKAPINPVTHELSGAPVLITAFLNTSRYMRGIDVDAEGNLYVVTKQTAGGNASGRLYRWDADQVAGDAPAALLSEENAKWNVEAVATTAFTMQGPAIAPNGDVYVLCTMGTERGVYYVGNKSASPTLTGPLSSANRVVSLDNINGESWAIGASATSTGNTYANLRSDAAGNIGIIERGQEQIRFFSAPGEKSFTVNAPVSQKFSIGGTAGVSDWNVY